MNGYGPRWRSRAVNLVLLGTAGSLATLLGGCSSGKTYSNEYHRNVYASAEDCAKDYSAAQCSTGGTNQLVGRYLGPAYRMIAGRPLACSASDPGPGRGLQSARLGIERGGFGPSCNRRRASRSSSRSWGS